MNYGIVPHNTFHIIISYNQAFVNNYFEEFVIVLGLKGKDWKKSLVFDGNKWKKTA